MHSKYDCHERAKLLIAEGTIVSLRYAALELRYCMEAITYEKLGASASHIPPHIVDTWQPPQAVKMLLEYEPEADKGFVIFAGIEEEYGKPSSNMEFVGEHKAFGFSWLRKHYNKVGGYLHNSQKKETKTESATEVQTYLRSVADEIEHVLKGSIIGGWMDNVHKIDCVRCGQPVIAGDKTLKKTRDIYCHNPNCRAEYFANVDAEHGSVSFVLKVTRFDCAKCGVEIPIENRMIDIGYEFKCDKCATKHRIEERQWGYSAETEPNAGEPAR
jgi:predicted RNA-binding Zn-ribbon protein involved in translation (DUF1610 family)